MRITVQEIADLVGGQVEGDSGEVLEGAAGLGEATATDVSYLSNPKYLGELQHTQAGALILPEGVEAPAGVTVIRVRQPQLAFVRVLGLVDARRERHPQGIHPTAVIDPTAQLDTDVSAGPYVVVEAGARVGRGTILHAGCTIGAEAVVGDHCLVYSRAVICHRVTVGNRVIIHPGAVVGSDGFGYATVEGTHHKIPQVGTVRVEDDVEIGANTTIDRGTIDATVIGRGTKLDNLVQIGHNVQVGRACLITAFVGIAGSTKIGNNVAIGGQAGFADHIEVGDNVYIAAQAGVIDNVPSNTRVAGTPAWPWRDTMRVVKYWQRLGEIFDDVRELKQAVFGADATKRDGPGSSDRKRSSRRGVYSTDADAPKEPGTPKEPDAPKDPEHGDEGPTAGTG